MDEFANGQLAENSRFVVNAKSVGHGAHSRWFLGRSAAAVAANECLPALVSDTGGSIRQQRRVRLRRALSDLWRVSRYGLVAFASSLDRSAFHEGCCAMRQRFSRFERP